MKSAQAHTTTDEIKFINGLGKTSLQAYLSASEHRSDWGDMNKEEVLAHCRKRIGTILERSERR